MASLSVSSKIHKLIVGLIMWISKFANWKWRHNQFGLFFRIYIGLIQSLFRDNWNNQCSKNGTLEITLEYTSIFSWFLMWPLTVCANCDEKFCKGTIALYKIQNTFADFSALERFYELKFGLYASFLMRNMMIEKFLENFEISNNLGISLESSHTT